MKHRMILSLTELMLMVLIFALAAAMCLQVFAASGRMSRRAEQRDQAVLLAQNAAERWKAHCLPEETMVLDTDWTETDGEGVYRVEVWETLESPLLSCAVITVLETQGGRSLFVLETARQEAAG